MADAAAGWKRVARIVRPMVIAYLLVVLMVSFLETWLVYPAPPRSEGNWSCGGQTHEEVEITSADGTRLHGWLFEHPSPEHVVIYLHGNGEHVGFSGRAMAELRRELDATVLVFDYRGYGKSEGKPFEAGVIEDGKAAQRWLAERLGMATSDIVLVGRSLGGGVAVAMAADQGAKALVLQNTFASMVDTAAKLYPWLPVRLVMRNRFNSLERIARYDGPVYQCHGRIDTLVPMSEGRRLFEAIPSQKKKFVELPGGHNDPFPEDYYPGLREFLDGLEGKNLEKMDGVGRFGA